MASLVGQGILISRETSVGGFVFDAELSETHSSPAEYPEHPVEFGASINDHKIIKPKVVTLRGVVGDFSLRKGSSFGEGSGDTRSQAAYNSLVELQSSDDLFSITTLTTSYRNMAIKEITAVKDNKTSTIIDFTVVCQEIIISTTESTSAPDSSFSPGKTLNEASSTKNLGSKQTQSVSQPVSDAISQR